MLNICIGFFVTYVLISLEHEWVNWGLRKGKFKQEKAKASMEQSCLISLHIGQETSKKVMCLQ